MILVDSSVWIEFLRDRRTLQTELLGRLIGEQRLATGDLILAEVLQGCTSDLAFERTRRVMTQSLVVLPIVDQSVAVAAARNYRLLRARGITVRKTIDTLIATRCLLDGHALLFADRDFQPFVAELGLLDAMTLDAP